MARKVRFDCSDLDPWLREATGICRDFTPSYEDMDLETYEAFTRRCEELSIDPEQFLAHGCKRDAHVMIPMGRLSFKDEGRSPDDRRRHSLTEQTRRRLADSTPPLGRRTQSPETLLSVVRRFGPVSVRGMTDQIKQGLVNYAVASRQAELGDTWKDITKKALRLPQNVGPLVNAGVPAGAASLMLGSRSSLPGVTLGLTLEENDPESIARSEVARLLGTSLQSTTRYTMALSINDSGQRFPPNVNAVLGGPIKAIRGMKRSAQELKLMGVQATLSDEEGPFDAKKFDLEAFRKATEDLTLPDRTSAFYQWLGKNVFAIGDGVEPFEVTFIFEYPAFSGKLLPVKLQHSKSAPGSRPPGRSDYTTLRGFDLESLPKVLARKVASPRKRRRGRTLTPLAKPNPTATRNPMARPSYLQPIDEFYLEQDFGPSGQFSYLYGEYGARPGLPTNRRNPRKGRKAKKATSKSRKSTARKSTARKSSSSGRKVTAWNRQFGIISKKAHAIMAKKGCSLKKAFAEARGGKRAAANRGKAKSNGGYRHSAKANRRRSVKKGLSPAQLRAGFGGKSAMHKARKNHGGNYLPEFEAHSTKIAQYWKPNRSASPSTLWPRETEYDYVMGAYGPSMVLPPVNRRNPRKKLSKKQLLAGFGGKAAQRRARSNKGKKRN